MTRGGVLRTATVVYVAAWVVGLVVAPAAPDPGAPDAEVHRFFSDHHGSTLVQALLVHGVAGVALAVFVAALAAGLRPPGGDRLRVLFLAAGLAAAAVSIAQLGVEIVLNRHVVTSDDAGTTAALFHAVNVLDTVKLALLGVAVASATRLAWEAGSLPAWLRSVGYALLPILVVGGLAFVVDSAVLTAVLDLSLIGLLVWVAAVGVKHAAAAAPR